MLDQVELVIITGMSGAGKTVAVHCFEDLGFYCIDNMPPSLIPTFLELMTNTSQKQKIALVMDLRTRDFFHELEETLLKIDNTQYITPRILFLDAEDQVLVSRYKESRRQHPLAENERLIVGIQREREMLQSIRARAQDIFDTSKTSPRQLRQMIMKKFSCESFEPFHVEAISFGFKFGIPIDADIIMDVRFLPNPHYVDELRPQTGLDDPVYDFVMKQVETEKFYQKFMDLIKHCLPGYKKEGKPSITIAIGCTGGKHRSVSLIRRMAQDLINDGYIVNTSHRDIDKNKETVKH